MQLPTLAGTFRASVNGSKVATAQFDLNRISLKIEDQEFVKHLFSLIPRKEKRLSNIHKVSVFLTNQRLTLELNDSRGNLLKMGSGINGLLGNFEIKPLRLRKYI